MATAARGWEGLKVYLEMIKIEHSVFALPFAMIGLMWGSRDHAGSPWPGWPLFLWTLVAMVSCRSAAMAFNRIRDRDVDALNPRTKARALPSGLLSLRTANLYFLASCAVFFLAAAMLNPLALTLSPVALAVTLFYSVTKRFTWLSHFVLGLSLGIAPAAAWIAASGSLSWRIVPLVAAVVLWTAGFDIIYSLQDEEFDREQRLRSLPERWGRARALFVSRVCHVMAAALLATAVALNTGGVFAYMGVVLACGLLAYEQSLVKPNDLSRVNVAFFTLNGIVSLGVFVCVLVDQVLSRSA